MTGTVARIGLGVGAFGFVGAFGTILPAEYPAVRIAAQILFGAPLAVWAILHLGRTRTDLDMPIGIALLLFVVVALFSRDTLGSLEMLAGALAWAVLFWAMADLRSAPARSAVAIGVVTALASWLGIFAVRWTEEKVTWVANGGGVPNLLESSHTLLWLTVNVAPVLALLGLGFIGYLPRSAAARIVTTVFVAAAVVAVPMSGGRAGWLGLVVAGLTLLLLGGMRLRRVVSDVRIWIAAAGGAVVVILVAATVGGRALDASGLTARMPLWREALSILADDPVTGGGPGTYSWLRLEHIEPYHAPVTAVLAHNVVLQTLADGGALLFAALAMVVVGTARAAWRRREAMKHQDRRVAAVLIGFAAVSLLDDHSSLPAIGAMVVTLAAWLVAPSEAGARADARVGGVAGGGRWSRHRRLVLLAIVASVAVTSLPATARVDLARLEANAGRASMLRGEYRVAIDAFRRAVDAYPARPNYHLSAGMALALDGQLDAAIEHYRRAAELAPADARAWAALASLARTDEERLASVRRAAAAPSADARYAFALGEVLERHASEDSLLAFARAAARAPGTVLALTPRDARAAAVADFVIANATRLSGEARSDPQEVRSDLALAGLWTPGDLLPAWEAIYALQHADPAGAQAALTEAIESAPLTRRTWQAATAVANYRCDDEAASAAAKLAELTPGRGTPRGELVYRSPDLAYREAGIASYQPVAPPYDPALLAWPNAYIDDARWCSP